MGTKRQRTSSVVAALAMAALALAGCQSTPEGRGGFARGLEASLSPIDSAADGSVRFAARDGGVTLLVHVTGLMPGTYRVAVHAKGNCSSPNGFSAGAMWDAPGAGPQVYAIFANSEGTATLTRRIGGVTLDALAERTVVLHEGGQGSLEARPGVRNGRIACGILGAPHTLL